MYLIGMFRDARTLANNAKRVTVNAKDCETARSLCVNSTLSVPAHTSL